MTQKQLEAMIKAEKRAVADYLSALEESDREESEERQPELTADELKQKIARIEEGLREHQEQLAEMKESGDTQRSLTDPDARLMKTTRGRDVCYNIQTAVDSKHKLIVDVEVTNEPGDQTLLPEMARKAKHGLGVDELTVVADGGYFSNEAIKTCEDEQITAYVPLRESEDAERKGLFSRKLFRYDEDRDMYICPQGAELAPTSRGTRASQRSSWKFWLYTTRRCSTCPVKARCTTSKTGRKIRRWVDHDVLDRLRARLEENPEILRRRKALVEHPFGNMKVAMGHDRLLMKGIENVATEIKLTVLSYNFKRVLSILGIEKLIEVLTSHNVRQKSLYIRCFAPT
jgi:transposase